MQYEVYNGYLKQFAEEEILVSNEPVFAEKIKDVEKREKEEFKKLEKLFKKESQDVEDLFNDPSSKGEQKFKLLKERILKTMKENSKQDTILSKLTGINEDFEKQIVESKVEV